MKRELVQKVITWGKEEGILDESDSIKQLSKMIEEMAELTHGLACGSIDDVADIIGDIQITLILLLELFNVEAFCKLDYDKCLQMAYNVISQRSGKMINGDFVKNDEM
jgi:hypothetical protein